MLHDKTSSSWSLPEVRTGEKTGKVSKKREKEAQPLLSKPITPLSFYAVRSCDILSICTVMSTKTSTLLNYICSKQYFNTLCKSHVHGIFEEMGSA